MNEQRDHECSMAEQDEKTVSKMERHQCEVTNYTVKDVVAFLEN